jgi:biopolymer transport protein ExbD
VSHLKGSFRRKITVPGFHLHSKYDLHFLRERQHQKKMRKSEPGLPLTALIDIFSMLVIFLLMNFSASGEIFFMSKAKIRIPDAKHSVPLENLPLITITSNEIIFAAAKGKAYIQPIPSTDEGFDGLRAKLQEFKRSEKPPDPSQPDKRKINIQADQKTPILEVKRIMTVLITEGWEGINFAVIRSESGGK